MLKHDKNQSQLFQASFICLMLIPRMSQIYTTVLQNLTQDV